MSTETMRGAFLSFTDKQLGVGASEQELYYAEKTLGVVFPESYRRFLGEYGWACFAHEQLYGLGENVPLHLDLIRNTMAERTEMHPLLPIQLIPVMNDGAGNHYCLDTRQLQNHECPVVFWDHEARHDQSPSLISSGFDSWLIELLNRLK